MHTVCKQTEHGKQRDAGGGGTVAVASAPAGRSQGFGRPSAGLPPELLAGVFLSHGLGGAGRPAQQSEGSRVVSLGLRAVGVATTPVGPANSYSPDISLRWVDGERAKGV